MGGALLLLVAVLITSACGADKDAPASPAKVTETELVGTWEGVGQMDRSSLVLDADHGYTLQDASWLTRGVWKFDGTRLLLPFGETVVVEYRIEPGPFGIARGRDGAVQLMGDGGADAVFMRP